MGFWSSPNINRPGKLILARLTAEDQVSSSAYFLLGVVPSLPSPIGR